MFKKVEAIIREEKLDGVKDHLEEIGVKGLTITDVKGHGTQLGIVEQYRGREYNIDLISKVKIEIVTSEDMVDPIIEVICKGAQTGENGDGKIFISPVEEIIRIRTNEKGLDAI